MTPTFRVASSKAEWVRRRKQLRARLWKLLGRLPARPKVPKIKTLSREDRGDYWVERFEFNNGARATVPGYLLLPKIRHHRAPAILYCHWHADEYHLGKEELFRAKHLPEAPGPALAKRGFVVLSIDAYGFGERNGRGPGGPSEIGQAGEWSESKFNLWIGRTLWGMMLRDDLMALDCLVRRPEVDPNQIAVIGMSMGATRAWWLMALDERIRTGVAICCLTRYQNLMKERLLRAHGIYYYVPDFLNHFDTETVVSLIAPRPVLFLNGDRDETSPLPGIRKIESVVKRVYRLYRSPSQFQSIVYSRQGHRCTPEMWRRSLKWLERKLWVGNGRSAKARSIHAAGSHSTNDPS